MTGSGVEIGQEPERLVTVATFTVPHEASLAQGRLEACDIPAFLVDQYAIGVSPLYSNALGGIKLQVFSSHLQEARALLQVDEVEDEETETPASPEENRLPKYFGWLFLALAAGAILAILALKNG